jgi:hypothetical protein
MLSSGNLLFLRLHVSAQHCIDSALITPALAFKELENTLGYLH